MQHRFLRLLSSPGILFVFATKWGLPVLVCLTGACFAGAVWDSFANSSHGIGGAIQALVATVNSDSASATGWTARMHFLLNLTIGWAGVRLYMATVGLKWDTFAARWLARSHAVILAGRSTAEDGSAVQRSGLAAEAPGIDRRSFAVEVALSMVRERPVTLCVPAIDESSRLRLWEAGVRVVVVDLSVPDLLSVTNARHARMVVAMRDSFDENVALVRSAFGQDHSGQLEGRLLVEQPPGAGRFLAEYYFDAAALPRIRAFSEAGLLARRLVMRFPPDARMATDPRARIHVLLFGFGSVGQAVALQLARLGHYRSGLRPMMTIIDRQAGASLQALLKTCPVIADWVEIKAIDAQVEDLTPGSESLVSSAETPFSIAYVCTKNEIINVRVANLVLSLATGRRPTMPVVALDPPGGCILAGFRSQKLAEQHDFHLLSLFPDADGKDEGKADILADLDDLSAMRLHATYCMKDDQECEREPGRPRARFNKPWSELPETAREANRGVADHAEIKLRAVGCTLVPAGAAGPCAFTNDEIELLARMEHDRWWANRALDGWSYAPTRDDTRKHHPNMVPFDKLDERTRQLDRDSVQEILKLYEDRGFAVARQAGHGSCSH